MLGTADLPGVSSIASAVAESATQDKIPWSALDYSGQVITSISGSAIGGQGGGDTSQCFPATASALLQPSGDYLSATDSGNFYPMTGNPSSFVQSGDLSAYAKESSVSGKLDASASSLFAPSGDYAFNSSLSSYIAYSAVAGDSGQITSINGSAIAGNADQSALSSMIPYSALDYSAGSQDITGISGSAFGVSGMTLIFDSSMNQTFSGNSSTVGVDVGSFIRAVGDASEATAANILYIVTGSVIV